MVEVRRKEKESVGMLLRRFVRRVQYSGILVRARSLRYRTPEESKREKKDQALKRIVWAKNMERLRKLGKID
ncbi:MAG: hypothetical protein A3C84_04050 [Candidatus Ryanbacteria bacterium RIFCSPHIGHO2_02_FULL_48_12]|jgi:ribosomal protein S21|uniref:30S ribosomal protein S21 n=1 Tax=Candidatus Ryanbacteria bacterium RIFCSPHIGHO2_01_FULL_48_27 TaxID=1802115 RepID=A0A1G2G5M8_9BACT|nr:MAG: hypothetical protein A2756_00905 [Candidatus Ryanbacteria bacterium RIFCSPHIGHO2_01_FULL_48_27]OGZ48543.1 MAG: hypothetical protein A3C84_04050 [Candidatus Ryanbacteria bacterium RIFCSPHIGHO2_02_FULL_48_12]